MGHSQSTLSGHGSNDTIQHPFSPHSPREFTYTPLVGRRSFRILRLTQNLRVGPRDWKDIELYGSIVEASLDKVPEYFALSYTWGDPSPTDRILINGLALGITQNCADALRRMLRGKLVRMLWVDSICINQANDAEALQERTRQIGFMDEIYSKATQVNVHLGSGDVKSDIAIEAVKRLFFAYLPALYAKNIGFGQEMTRRRYEEVADEVTAFSLEFPYGKLHGLFRLPWFQRTWVIQEVALARKVMFYCGDHLLAFDVLAAAADFTRLPYSKANGLAHHWKFYLDPHHTVAEFIRRRGQGENVEHIYGILKLLSVTFGRDATKPEDKIHGLYGCAKRLGLNWPIPDYTKSVAQVYTEVTLACLNEDGSLDVLERAEGAAALEFELPSWVPNFSKSIRESSPTERPTWNMPSKRNDMISGRSQCQWSIMPGGRRLKVLGRRLDQVAAVSEPWNIDISTTMLGGATRNSGEIWKNLIDCIPSWLEVVLQRNRNDGRGRKAADVIVDMQDLAHLMVNGHPSPTEPPAQIIEDLVSSLNSARVPANLSLRSRERIFEHITHLMGKLVFRTSTKNYLGTGSCSSSSGDLVVVLHGMAVPCLMRPCPEGFTFVGAAFVDKILDGEFWSAGSNADDEWFMLM